MKKKGNRSSSRSPDNLDFIVINGTVVLICIIWNLLLNMSWIFWTFFGFGFLIFFIYLKPSNWDVLFSQGLYQNWSGQNQFKFGEYLIPSTLTEIKEIIKRAKVENKKIKVIGNAHASNDIIRCDPNGVVIDMRKFNQITIDEESKTVRVGAGTQLSELNTRLWKKGLSLNLVGIDSTRTVGGACQIGAHGTGLKNGCLSTLIREITIVTGEGEEEVLSEKQTDFFAAARVGLGAFGVITEITLQCDTSFFIKKEESVVNFTQALEQIKESASKNDFFMLCWFPHTDLARTVSVKRATQAEINAAAAIPFHLVLLQTVLQVPLRIFVNVAVWVFSLWDRLVPLGNTFLVKLFPLSTGVGPSYSRISFTDDNNTVTLSSETDIYVPSDQIASFLKDFQDFLKRNKFVLNIAVSIRFVAADDIYLSPFNSRSTAVVTVGMVNNPIKWKKFLTSIREFMVKRDARPAWGKPHACKPIELGASYTRWQTFLDLRRSKDPDNLFVNQHLGQIFDSTN